MKNKKIIRLIFIEISKKNLKFGPWGDITQFGTQFTPVSRKKTEPGSENKNWNIGKTVL